ncbi:Hypothetical protein PYTT_1068 [Akkermansia glycaniphila]|uniref:Uncharacterized protein n=1 Tax=Akkermansia glycaniphila TaxID=1679444 RepID=A0A1H6LF27_9BACT|nr:Hypothetical protein PYTT_1068 [Akkermansia glycaniphila]
MKKNGTVQQTALYQKNECPKITLTSSDASPKIQEL